MANNILLTFFIGAIAILLFLAFLKSPLRGETPIEMQQKAEELKEETKTKLELARETYNVVDEKYNSTIRGYLKYPERVILKNKEEIWDLDMQYLPSNSQNEIFKELLILTEEFKENDFVFVQTKCNTFPTNTPHEYWELNVSSQIIFIDLWGEDQFNESIFGCWTPPPCAIELICAEGFP